MTQQRLSIQIQGAVQGVGFRPYVYRLARELGLSGWVLNDARGVQIEAEGPREPLERLLERLPAELPPLALIHSLESHWLPAVGYRGFEIRHSDEQGSKHTAIVPDIATCPECLAEVLDPRARRSGYPFTNCTNCGPRLTIIEALPYDRPNTSMRGFALCPACRSEYYDPGDRRFHAQPIACPACGPWLECWIPDSGMPDGLRRLTWPEPLQLVAEALLQGKIVAVKGLGGFLLCCDARNAQAVALLRERKRRPHKPLALMVRDLEQAATLVEIPPLAWPLLRSPEAPIVLLRRRQRAALASNIAPGNPYLGLMLPNTPLHHLLLRAVDFPLVATSGNLSDEPICIDEHEALARLGAIADLFLVHNRPIVRHCDDSVATLMHGGPVILRRARGYAPMPLLLPDTLPCVLAVGAHQKNTVALSVGRQAILSQHIGDLETVEAIVAFERVIADFLRLYEATPLAIAHDLHPDYTSSHWARSYSTSSGCRSIAVQHHHAHLAACLAEHQVEQTTLGVIWDGTGYGPDGTIWGGEFLLGNAQGYRRVAHLQPFLLPGGEAAVREPRRAALALLWELEGAAVFDRDDLPAVASCSSAERQLFAHMLARGVSSMRCSSAGRLFDGVAALLGLHPRASFEGQAAMALEFCVDHSIGSAYPFELRPAAAAEQPLLLDWRPLIAALLVDLQLGAAPATIAARFHNALSAAIVEVARSVGVQRVALSGGCFQNRLLTERTAASLEAAGFEVLLHRRVPPNDGGISLGQLAIAAAQLG